MGIVPEEPSAPPVEQSPKKKKPKKDVSTFNYSGNNLNMETLGLLHFVEGAKVYKKESKKEKAAEQPVIYVLSEVTEETVKLTPEDEEAKGEKVEIPSTRLVDEYIAKEVKKEYTMLHDSVPVFTLGKEPEIAMVKGMVLQALKHLAKAGQPKCNVVLLPKRSVQASIGYKKKGMELVAFTTNIGHHQVDHKPASGIKIDTPAIASDPKTLIHLSAAKFTLPQKEQEEVMSKHFEKNSVPSVVPFWLVDKVPEKEHANLVRGWKKVPLTTGDGDSVTISIPYLYNNKDIVEGEPLVVHEEPPTVAQSPTVGNTGKGKDGKTGQGKGDKKPKGKGKGKSKA